MCVGRAVTVDPGDRRAFRRLITALESKRVIFVGETHDRYDHHLNQLATIRGLNEAGVDLAVGMEFFQEPSLASRILSSDDKHRAAAERHPLQAIGQPDDVAKTVLWLLRDAPMVTGQVIACDGGLSSLRLLR